MKLSTTEKRKQVIERLKQQLDAGVKPRKNGKMWTDYNPEEIKLDGNGKPVAIRLNGNDIDRIKKEIQTLNARV